MVAYRAKAGDCCVPLQRITAELEMPPFLISLLNAHQAAPQAQQELSQQGPWHQRQAGHHADVWFLAGPPAPRWWEMKEDGCSWVGSVGRAKPSHYLNVLKKGKNSKRRRAKGWRDAQPVQTTHAGVQPCPDGPPSWWPCRARVSKKHKLESYRGNMNVMHHQAVLTSSFHRSTSLLPLVSCYLKNTSISETVEKKVHSLVWLNLTLGRVWAWFSAVLFQADTSTLPWWHHLDYFWFIVIEKNWVLYNNANNQRHKAKIVPSSCTFTLHDILNS